MDMERSEEGAARNARYELQHTVPEGHLALSPQTTDAESSVTNTVDPSEDRPPPLPHSPSPAPVPDPESAAADADLESRYDQH